MKKWIVTAYISDDPSDRDAWIIYADTEQEARNKAAQQVKAAYPQAIASGVIDYDDPQSKHFMRHSDDVLRTVDLSKYVPDWVTPEKAHEFFEPRSKVDPLQGMHQLSYDDLLDMWQKAKTLPEPQRQKAIRQITQLSTQLESKPAQVIVSLLLENSDTRVRPRI